MKPLTTFRPIILTILMATAVWINGNSASAAEPQTLPVAGEFDRQVAEIQIRIAALNRYTAFGLPVTKPAG